MTETSFPVVRARNSHALLADTFVEIERWTDIDGSAETGLDWGRQWSPVELWSCL